MKYEVFITYNLWDQHIDHSIMFQFLNLVQLKDHFIILNLTGPCPIEILYHGQIVEVIPPNGTAEVQNTYLEGTVIRGSCRNGYHLTGNATNECTGDGWRHPIFTCDGNYMSFFVLDRILSMNNFR